MSTNWFHPEWSNICSGLFHYINNIIIWVFLGVWFGFFFGGGGYSKSYFSVTSNNDTVTTA